MVTASAPAPAGPVAPDALAGPAAPAAPVVWLTGLPSAGKSTLAHALADRLRADGRPVEVLDGDAVRAVLGHGLGFSRADRAEQVRRIGWVADLLSRHGVTAVCAVISPYRADRDALRASLGARFVEVWVSTPVEVCRARDVKGLYARHAAGELAGLTGVDDPYEAPEAPELELPTERIALADAVEALWRSVS